MSGGTGTQVGERPVPAETHRKRCLLSAKLVSPGSCVNTELAVCSPTQRCGPWLGPRPGMEKGCLQGRRRKNPVVGVQALSFGCFLPIEIQPVGSLAVCTLSWAWCPPGVTTPPTPGVRRMEFWLVPPLSPGPTQILNLKEGSHPPLLGARLTTASWGPRNLPPEAVPTS